MNLTNTAKKTLAGAATAALLLSPIALTFGALQTAFAAAPAASVEATGVYSVDKPHTDISFSVTHLGLTHVHGRFDDFDGTVKVDGKKPGASSVEFAIKAASIDTDNSQRDAHLKSPAFFDVEKFPEIMFKSTHVAKLPKGGFAATGDLTMHGVTKVVVLPFEVVGPLVSPLDKGTHLGVSTSITIKRSDYGITYGPGVVGDDVAISIELDLVKNGSMPPPPAK